MAKIQLKTVINASREKVWHIMLDDATYREWTAAFNPGSHYVGEWTEGSKILFLGPSPTEEGQEGGMVSIVEKVQPYEFVSIRHIGVYGNGVEDTESEEALKWAGHENYVLEENGTGTELTIDQDVPESGREYMEDAWKKAFVILKELAEK